MALTTDKPIVARYKLIDHAASGSSNYSTGGTDLGHVLSHAVVGLHRDMENLTKQIYGTHWVDGVFLGENVTIEVVLGQRSSDVLKLMSRTHWQNSVGSGLLLKAPQIKPGYRVKANSYTTRLQIRPVIQAGTVDNALPHLYLPHAFCIDVGPRQYNDKGKHFEATVLTIVGYYDETNGYAYVEGDPTVSSAFPTLS